MDCVYPYLTGNTFCRKHNADLIMFVEENVDTERISKMFTHDAFSICFPTKFNGWVRNCWTLIEAIYTGFLPKRYSCTVLTGQCRTLIDEKSQGFRCCIFIVLPVR